MFRASKQITFERRDRGGRREEMPKDFSACSASSAFKRRIFSQALKPVDGGPVLRNYFVRPPLASSRRQVILVLAQPQGSALAAAPSLGRSLRAAQRPATDQD